MSEWMNLGNESVNEHEQTDQQCNDNETRSKSDEKGNYSSLMVVSTEDTYHVVINC